MADDPQPRTFRLLRGGTPQNEAFTGDEGTLTYDRDTQQVRVHDGVTPGGHPTGIKDTAEATPQVRINGDWLALNTVVLDYGELSDWVSEYGIGEAVEGGIYAGVYECNGEEFHLIVSTEVLTTDPVIWSEYDADYDATSACDFVANTEKLVNVRWQAEALDGVLGSGVNDIAFANPDYSNIETDSYEWVAVAYTDGPVKVYRSTDWSVGVSLDDLPHGAVSVTISNHAKRLAIGYATEPYLVVVELTIPATPTDPIPYVEIPFGEGEAPTTPVFDLASSAYYGHLYVATANGLDLYAWRNATTLSRTASSPGVVTADPPVTSARLMSHYYNSGVLGAVYGDQLRVVDWWWDWAPVVNLAPAGVPIATSVSAAYDTPDTLAIVHSEGNRYTLYKTGYSVDQWFPVDNMPPLGEVTPVDTAFSPDGQYLLVAIVEAPYLLAVDILNKRIVTVGCEGPIHRLEQRFNRDELYVMLDDRSRVLRYQSGREFSVTRHIPSSFWGYDPEVSDQIGHGDLVVSPDGKYLISWVDNTIRDVHTLTEVATHTLDSNYRFSNDRQYLGDRRVDSGDGMPYVLNAQTLERVTVAASSNFPAANIAAIWTAWDGNTYLLFANDSGKILAYDLFTGTQKSDTLVVPNASLTTPQVVNDQYLFFSRGSSNPPVFVDMTTNTIAHTLDDTRFDNGRGFWVDDRNADGTYVAITANYETGHEWEGVNVIDPRVVLIIDTQTLEIVTQLSERSWINKAWFTTDGRYLVTDQDYDPMTTVYEVGTWQAIARYPLLTKIYGFTDRGEIVLGITHTQDRWSWAGEETYYLRMNADVPAAQLATQYTAGDHTDWGLPSTDQLTLLQQNLPDLAATPLWSSREASLSDAYASDGVVGKDDVTRHVVAVRAFKTS